MARQNTSLFFGMLASAGVWFTGCHHTTEVSKPCAKEGPMNSQLALLDDISDEELSTLAEEEARAEDKVCAGGQRVY